MRSFRIMATCVAAILCFLAAGIGFSQGDSQTRISALPEGLYALIATSKGDIIVSLDYAKAPLTVINFVGLAEGTLLGAKVRQGLPFYDGLSFHRVIDQFMIQGGCPVGDGSGDPGYEFSDEFDPSLRFDRPGVLAMANGGPSTNGSQFFITQAETPWLDDMHTIFGHVVGPQDQEVVDKIALGNGSEGQNDQIISIKIVRRGGAAESFRTDQVAWDAAYVVAEERQKAWNEAKAREIEKGILDIIPGADKDESGIYFAVMRKGSGTRPLQGQIVTIHCVIGLLDGVLIDSTSARGQPVSFQIGIGKILPGLDLEIMEMEVGEIRAMVVPPELAYGAQGNGPIPGGSHVYFEVELLEAK